MLLITLVAELFLPMKIFTMTYRRRILSFTSFQKRWKRKLSIVWRYRRYWWDAFGWRYLRLRLLFYDRRWLLVWRRWRARRRGLYALTVVNENGKVLKAFPINIWKLFFKQFEAHSPNALVEIVTDNFEGCNFGSVCHMSAHASAKVVIADSHNP